MSTFNFGICGQPEISPTGNGWSIPAYTKNVDRRTRHETGLDGDLHSRKLMEEERDRDAAMTGRRWAVNSRAPQIVSPDGKNMSCVHFFAKRIWHEQVGML